MTRAAPPDLGTPERARHDPVAIQDTMAAGIKRARVVTVDWLDRYYRRGHLGTADFGERRYAAGGKLREDWTVAGLEPRMIGSYADRIVKTPTLYDPRIAAYRRWQAAMLALGPCADLVATCCCLGHFVGRDGLAVLRLGLDALADHYGMAPRTRCEAP